MRVLRWFLGSRWVRIGFALVALLFIVLAVIDQWHRIRPRLDSISVTTGVLGVVSIVVGLGATMLCWRRLLADLGSRLPVTAVAQIFFAGQLGKYVPGSIWPVVVQAELAVERGAGRKRPVAATLVQMGLTLATGALLAVVTLPFVVTHTGPELLLIPVVIVAAIVGLHPRVTNPVINTVFRLIRREPLEEPLSYRGPAVAACWQSLGWILFGVPVVLLTRDMGGSGGHIVLLGIGAFAASFVAGFVVPVLPAGAGLREVVMVALLATEISTASALTVALVSRLMMTVGDVITGGAAIGSMGWDHFAQLRARRERALEADAPNLSGIDSTPPALDR